MYTGDLVELELIQYSRVILKCQQEISIFLCFLGYVLFNSYPYAPRIHSAIWRHESDDTYPAFSGQLLLFHRHTETFLH